MTLQDNDQFMVSRGDTPYSVDSQTLVAKLEDSDLMLVCRSGVPYKATGAEIKDSLGSGSINPGLNDITLDPAAPGSGTEADPYILQGQVVAPFGSTAESVETITIIGQPPEASVVWRDNSVDAGNRFAQVTGELTDANGVWTGKLEYADIPDSTEDTTYVGKLNIGLVYFQWTITQKAVDTAPTVVTNVSLVESSPAEGDRFTSQSFVASSQVTDGLPVSTKTIDAHVDGTLSRQVKFTEPLESSATTELGPIYSDLATLNPGLGNSWMPGPTAAAAFDGDLSTLLSTDTNTTVQQELWRFTITQEIANSWNAASAVTFYNVPGNGTAGSSSCAVWRNGATKLNDTEYTPTVPMNLYNLVGPIRDWVAGDYLFITNATNVGGNGPCYGISHTIGGVETFLVDGVSQTTLTFPASADMEGLAGGDAISQVVNFTEPLESQGTSTDYLAATSFTPSANSLTAPERAKFFDGNPDTFMTSLAGTWTAGSGSIDIQLPVPITGVEKIMFSVDKAIVDSGSLTPSLIYNATSQGSVINMPRVDEGTTYLTTFTPDNAPLSSIGFDLTLNATVNTDWIVGNGFKVFKTDGTSFWLTSGQTNLTFPAAADMAALAPGDAVSQAGGSSGAETWSNGLSTTTGTIETPTNAFNGSGGNGAYTTETYGKITWDIGYDINGKTIKVQTGSENTIYYFTFNTIAGEFSRTATSNGIGIVTYNLNDLYLDGVVIDNFMLQIDGPWPINIKIIYLDDEIVLDGQPIAITNTGTVGSIAGTTATLSSSSGTWVNGADVTTGDKTTTGTVGSVDKPNTTATLSSSSGTWVNGVDVVGPQKTIVEENARLYCAFDSNGNVTDLQNNPQDPPYTTQDSNPGLTFTFPATFPSGQTPDEELPDGTTFTVEVLAANSTSASGPVTATVQPEPGTPDAPLAGLTTLWTGNNGSGGNASRSIVNGINNQDDGGLVWIKARSNDNWHWLYDTLRGTNSLLFSNGTADAQGSPALTSFDTDGFTIFSPSANTPGENYVGWNFGKAEKYFDVVQWSGSNSNQTISHELNSEVGCMIIKNRSANGTSWAVYHKDIGTSVFLKLDVSSGTSAAGDLWQNTTPTSTEFYLGGDQSYVNQSGSDYIAYLFAEDTPGVIKCGASGPAGIQVECGFRPQWVLLKAPDETYDWMIADDKRPSNPQLLFPNTNGVENYGNIIEFNDTGFVQNWATNSAIYVAIAAPPIARSQTNEEYVESQAKFLTYDNRKQVKQGEEALDDREGVIKQAEDLGLDVSQIKKLIGK